MTTPSIQYPERIDSKWFPLTNTVEVDVVRTATLNDDLSEIVSRRVSSIEVTLGQGNQRQTLHLDQDLVAWLSRALVKALVRAADDDPAAHLTADAEGGAGDE